MVQLVALGRAISDFFVADLASRFGVATSFVAAPNTDRGSTRAVRRVAAGFSCGSEPEYIDSKRIPAAQRLKLEIIEGAPNTVSPNSQPDPCPIALAAVLAAVPGDFPQEKLVTVS